MNGKFSLKIIIAGVLVASVVLGWLSGHYGFWPKQHTTGPYSFSAAEDIAKLKDPRLCREILSPLDRYDCEISATHQLAYDFSVDDCKTIPATHFLERGYCLREAVSSDLYPKSHDCNLIVESYYRRWCHVNLLPGELLTFGGLTTVFEAAASLLFVALIFYLSCAEYVARRKRYPTLKLSISLSFIFWFAMAALSMVNPFSLFFYHAAVIERIVCPPSSEVCIETGHGWLSFSSPTLWGIFAMTFLMPMIYFAIGKFAASFHRKYGGLKEVRTRFPRARRYWKHMALLLVVVYGTWFGYAFLRLSESITIPVKPMPPPVPTIQLATSSWTTFHGMGYEFKYPASASVSTTSDVVIDLRPTLGILPEFKDEWGNYSSVSDFAFRISTTMLQSSDPTDAKAYLQKYGDGRNLSRAQWCKTSNFSGIDACYVADQAYGQDDLQAYLRYHYYFVRDGYFFHITAISSLQDLSKARMIDRRNYTLLLQYMPVVDEIIKSFKLTKSI